MKTHWPPTSTHQQREATGELLRRLFSLCPERLSQVALFGSTARGDFGDDSDIDLLIVADRTDAALEHALRTTAARASLDYDVIFNLHIYSRALWEQMHAQKRPLAQKVEDEGINLMPAPSGL